jgi:hypothetical protein
MGAALACGPGAALTHRSAAALVGLRPSASVRIEVTVPRPASRGHSIRGIVVCGRPTLSAPDISVWDGIPCVSIARILLDLCEQLDDDAVAKASPEPSSGDRRLRDPRHPRGLRERRLTWRQLEEEPERVADTLDRADNRTVFGR